MPEPDPQAGRAYIVTVCCFLFICIATGGGCLVAYISRSDQYHESSLVLPVLGFVLVCLPWLFWIVTILYRMVSRAYGFRMVIGSLYNYNGSGGGGGGGGGGGAAGTGGDIAVAAAVVDDGAQVLDVSAKSPENNNNYEGRRVQFGETRVNGGGDNTKSSNSSSSNDISRASHESEIPLALSMAS